ncbi:acetoacetate decarboxylase family protein [Acidobacteriota bacterium]
MPISDGVISFVFLKLKIISPVKFDYQEAYFSIPVSYKDIIGGYQPVLYLTKIESILPGREIYGYNKTLADITFEEEKNQTSISVRRMDTLIIKATFEKGESRPPAASGSSPYSFFHKFIPSIEKNAKPAVNQLALVELTNSTISDFRPCKASLELFNTKYDPFDKIPVLKIIDAGYLENVFTLGYGKILYDYNQGK